MSQTNDPGEENDRNDPISEEFEFYFPFAKTLALDLPTPEDTSIAAAWVQKLEMEPESEEEKRTRLNYLKLLLFVLQRGRLIGIFKKQPPSAALQPLPQGLSILDMGNMMLEQDDTPTCGEGDARCLPYFIEISNDLREFVASQEIPNFGVQMYYAWSSDEPVHKWLCFDEEKFPQFVLDKIKQLKEAKSDEKSTVVKDGCIVSKTGCDISLIEKCGKKKVKSPQEIEKSQGRSFHTYMGLVGRMGNFSDKCGDDPDKYQRQDPRKGKCARKNLQKRYPGSGGEADEIPMEDDVENYVDGISGLSPLNRPCLCPFPPVQANYPGGPQYYQDRQSPGMNYTFSVGSRNQTEFPQWTPSENRTPAQRSYEVERCPEEVAAIQSIQPQRRSPSPQPRSISPNHPNTDCPPQDDGGGFDNQVAMCCCTSPPCNCPCPRSVSQGPLRKTPPSANLLGGGRGPADPSLTCPKQRTGAYRIKREDPCAQGPDPGPSGACRPGAGPEPNARKKSPQIIHCYDGQNPDPCLTQTIDTMKWVRELDDKTFIKETIKDYCAKENSTQPTFQRTNAPLPGEAYDPCQQQVKVQTSTCPPMSGMKQQSDRYSPTSVEQRPPAPSKRSPRTPSPQVTTRPVCQVPQEPQQQFRPNRQFPVSSQQYGQSYQGPENARAGQVCPAATKDVWKRSPADPFSPPLQSGNQIDNPCAFLKSPPGASEPSPAGLTGRPPQEHGVCGRPATDPCAQSQYGNQIEDLCAFLYKSPPKASGPTQAGPSIRPASRQGRPPTPQDACKRPAADSCKPSPQSASQQDDSFGFLDKFPPDVPGLTPPPFENVFRRGATNPCTPPSPHWNEPENLYEFGDLFQSNAEYDSTSYQSGGSAPAASPCEPPLQTGNQVEDLCAFLSAAPPKASGPSPATCRPPLGHSAASQGVCGRPPADPCKQPNWPGNYMQDLCGLFDKPPPKAAEPSPAGLSGKPPQGVCGRPPADPCRPPSRPGNQIDDLCTFLNKTPPKAPPNSPAACRPAQGQPAAPQGVCTRPAADPCKSSQSANQQRDSFAFLDKFPPDVPGLTPPPFEDVFKGSAADACSPPSPHWNEPQNFYDFIDALSPSTAAAIKSARMAAVTALLREINKRKEAYREKCDRLGSRKPPGNAAGVCQPSGQPTTNACPDKALPPSGTTFAVHCPESRPPRTRVCPDTGGHRRQPTTNVATGNRGKTQQPLPLRQTMHPSCPPALGNAGQKACPQEEDEGESSESGEEFAKECAPTCAPPSASQRIPGPPQQAQTPSRVPNVQSYTSQRVVSGKPPQQQPSNFGAGAVGQGPAPKMVITGDSYIHDSTVYKELNLYGKPSPGKVAEKEYDDDYDDIRDSACELEKQLYVPETDSSRKAEKQSFSGKTSPGKLSKQESKASAQMPTAGTGYGKREPEAQSCPSQNAGLAQVGGLDQTPEHWPDFGNDYCDKTLSGSALQDNETPTCFPLVWGSDSPEAEGPEKRPNVQDSNLSQWMSVGKIGTQEPSQSFPQPGNSTRIISPRTQLSQNKLPQKISSSKTYQSFTDTKSKSARKPISTPSKSETRSDYGTEAKSKIESKTKIKSETQMKIKSETQTKIRPERQTTIKPETQKKIKSQPNMKFKYEPSTKFKSESSTKFKSESSTKFKSESSTKFKSECSTKRKSNSNTKFTCISMDLIFDSKRKGPHQGGPSGAMPLCRPDQQNASVYDIPSFKGNPYVEKSLMYHKRMPLGMAFSTPNERIPEHETLPSYSVINQYDTSCELSTMAEQPETDYGEEEDETTEYMPLYDLNADISVGRFFNLPGTDPQQCPQEDFGPNNAFDRLRSEAQGVTFQTFQIDDTFEYCDNNENGYY